VSDACHLLRIFGALDQTRCRASKQRELTHAELVMTYYPHNIHHKDCPNGAPLSLERTAHIDPDSLVANVTFAQFERFVTFLVVSLFQILFRDSCFESTTLLCFLLLSHMFPQVPH
jgi:hypothetical protein